LWIAASRRNSKP
jgi:chromosome segregation protein